jgi:hypothetical protein
MIELKNITLFRESAKGFGVRLCAEVLFSDEDADLREVPWSFDKDGYARLKSSNPGGQRYAHRIVLERALGRRLESHEIADHYNRNRVDNRRCNLSIVTFKQNRQNIQQRPDIPRGAHFEKSSGKWRARVKLSGKYYQKHGFSTPDEAAQWAVMKRKELGFHGE